MSIHSRFQLVGIVTMGVLLASFSACSKKTAEEKGAEMAAEKIDMAKGIGGVLEEKGSAAAESLTTGMGNVVKGIGKGVEKSGRVIVAAPTVATAGLNITKLQDSTPGTETSIHGLEAYVVANANAKGKMRVIAYDLTDHEIGRAKVDLVREADEGKYLSIPFDAQVKLESIARVEFDFQPEAAAAKK
jgi:hypothetical protein